MAEARKTGEMPASAMVSSVGSVGMVCGLGLGLGLTIGIPPPEARGEEGGVGRARAGVRNDRAWWVRSQPFAIDGMLGRPSSEHDGAAWGVMVSARRGWSARMRLKQMCSRGIHVGWSARAHLKRHGHGDGRARQLGRGAQHRAGRGEGRRRRHEGEEQLQNGHQAVWASGWRARGLGRMGVKRRNVSRPLDKRA